MAPLTPAAREAALDAVLALTGQRAATTPEAACVALRLALPFLSSGRGGAAGVFTRLAGAVDPHHPVSVPVAWWGKAVLGVRTRDLRGADISACAVVEPDLRPVLLAIYDHANGLGWYTRWYAATQPFRDGIAELRRCARDQPELQQLIGPLRAMTYPDVEDLLRLLGRDATASELRDGVALVRSLHKQVADLRASGYWLSHPVFDGPLRSHGLDGSAAELVDEILAFLPRGRPTPVEVVTAEIAAGLAPLAGTAEGDVADAWLRALGVPLAPRPAPATAAPAPSPVTPRSEAVVPVQDAAAAAAATAQEHLELALRILADEASAPPAEGSPPLS